MKQQLDQVKLFMKAVKQDVPNEITRIDDKTLALRLRLTREEVNEFEEAVHNNDKIEMLDALNDRLYVLLGDYAACGVDSELMVLMFDEVHTSNMTKLMPDGTAIMDELGKVQKPPHYKKPNLRKVIEDYEARKQ
jgi:predicted HAD superfamily Cof-like phosphohydrolase